MGPILALATILLVAACGSDEPTTLTPVALQNSYLAVGGNYKVAMTPHSNTCPGLEPYGSQEIFHVQQIGEYLAIDMDPFSASSPLPYGFYVNVNDFDGTLYISGDFIAYTGGSYYDSVTGFSGAVSWQLTGYFGFNSIEGISDNVFADPFYGTCRISHSFFGVR